MINFFKRNIFFHLIQKMIRLLEKNDLINMFQLSFAILSIKKLYFDNLYLKL